MGKPSNALKDFGANAHSRPGTLKKCQGDCDNDSHCDTGLKCFQRMGYTTVPGCTGKGVNHHDYCITDPNALKDFGVSAHTKGKLKLCEGDCDSDGHCATGLNCFRRSG